MLFQAHGHSFRISIEGNATVAGLHRTVSWIAALAIIIKQIIRCVISVLVIQIAVRLLSCHYHHSSETLNRNRRFHNIYVHAKRPTKCSMNGLACMDVNIPEFYDNCDCRVCAERSCRWCLLSNTKNSHPNQPWNVDGTPMGNGNKDDSNLNWGTSLKHIVLLLSIEDDRCAFSSILLLFASSPLLGCQSPVCVFECELFVCQQHSIGKICCIWERLPHDVCRFESTRIDI